MDITSIRLRRAGGNDRVKAAASVCFDGQFVVHGIRIIEGPNGLFVSMPARKTTGGDYRDLAHPVTADAREMIQDAVLLAYEEWAGQQAEREEAVATV